VDIQTSTLLATIPTDPNPQTAQPSTPVISLDGRTAYVANFGTGTIGVLDLVGLTRRSTITVRGNPYGLALSPDGTRLWTADGFTNQLTEINTSKNKIVARYALKGLPAMAAVNTLAISPDGTTLWAGLNYPGTTGGAVIPVNTSTGKAGPAVIVAGANPIGEQLTPDGKTLWVPGQAVGNELPSITPVDTALRSAGTPVPTDGSPGWIAISPDGQRAYTTQGQTASGTALNELVAYDLVTRSRLWAVSWNLSTPPGGPFGVALTPDGTTAWVALQNDGLLVPVNTATGTAGTAVNVGGAPFDPAITPDQAPHAAFTATPGHSGTTTTFDGSQSFPITGTIAQYAWNFGDGASLTTTTPTTSHLYAAAGTYTVTLTVTDSAGTSTQVVFTGQSALRNGNSAAISSQRVTIVP
jgi:YVTN family beta-propeller protein